MNFRGVEDSNPHGFQGCRAGAEHILKRYKYNATTDPYVNLDEETTVIVDKIILRIKRGLRIRKQGTGIRANTPTQWYSKFAAGAVGLALQKNALGRKDLEDEIPKAILEQYFLNVIELVNSMVTALYHGSWGQEAYLLYHAFAGQKLLNMINLQSFNSSQANTLCSKISHGLVVAAACGRAIT